GGTGVRVCRGRRGRRPREGNDEHVDDLNWQGNDQGMGANEGIEGVNRNAKGANGGAPDFLTIIAQQLQNLLPTMLAQKVTFVVNSVFAEGADLVLFKEFAIVALQVTKIHPLNQTLSMILQTFSPTLYNLSTRLTRTSYVGMILTMVMIVHHGVNEGNQDKIKEMNQVTHTSEPLRRFNSICYDDYDYEEGTFPLSDIISQIPPSIVITTSPPVLPIKDLEVSLIMGNEELNTILEKESDKFIKSSVADLFPIPSESEDTSRNDSECILPSCDDFSPIIVFEEESVTFSNPFFDSNNDFTSSDDESISDEDVPEDNVKIYSNPLFKFDDEYISNDVNPLFDEVLEDIECKDSYDSNLDELTFLVTHLLDVNKDEYFAP
nr:hypothetical protein [Tanacetum cinerariifolium]